ncbi:alpha-amylase family protein [Thermoleptolyngbya sp. C42_A2020_037]|uniref:alpha-amylase n=1 Tax=Thermoleptolyngbya sp. C42_A2020_037 TaxID=2747799 RepID=UPI0019DFA682|nr:alpha-amylase family protein [Thermoleptolyngbya sp. C42_A2020_037]MBF2086920.1 alpha-amylase family protein [Thermoleptolyngbya sp. C42_A2020_037]
MRHPFTLGASLLALTALLMTGCARPAGRAAAVEDAEMIKSRPSQAAMVHLFEWRWDDIAQECETVLGPNGYAAVQISPPQEHVVLPERGFPWWQRYQPVSYRLESRSGDRAQLASMIRRCHAAGVKVYADAVINHMAGVEQGIGSAGSAFTKYEYPGIYQPQDFNDCRRNIESYQNHDEVTGCELVGLADLKTSTPDVQRRLAEYLADLVSLGIDGFRIDAAKHINARDLDGILNQLEQVLAEQKAGKTLADLFIYQEVIDPGTEAVKKGEYYASGDVFEFEYGRVVSEKFAGLDGQTLAQLETLGEGWGFVPSEKAVVFIDNHDKQRGHGGGGNYLTYKDGPLYDLANVFMLAHPYGKPLVMSSYDFSDGDQGPPADAKGNTQSPLSPNAATCTDGWICEHRRSPIVQMVQFRNAAGDAPLVNWWSNGQNQIAFGRGDRAFVVINRESQPLTHTFQTSLPPGRYCDLLQPSASNPATCATPITVQPNGQATFTLSGMSAAAIRVMN